MKDIWRHLGWIKNTKKSQESTISWIFSYKYFSTDAMKSKTTYEKDVTFNSQEWTRIYFKDLCRASINWIQSYNPDYMSAVMNKVQIQ